MTFHTVYARMNLLSAVKRLIGWELRTPKGDDGDTYRCVKCGETFERDYYTCPDCGSEYVAPLETE